jgi:hypothetical protein
VAARVDRLDGSRHADPAPNIEPHTPTTGPPDLAVPLGPCAPSPITEALEPTRAKGTIEGAKQAVFELRSRDEPARAFGGRVELSVDRRRVVTGYYSAMSLAERLGESELDVRAGLADFVSGVSCPADLRGLLYEIAKTRSGATSTAMSGPLGTKEYESFEDLRSAMDGKVPGAVCASDQSLIIMFGVGDKPRDIRDLVRSEDPEVRAQEVLLAARLAELGVAYERCLGAPTSGVGELADISGLSKGLASTQENAGLLRRLCRATGWSEGLIPLGDRTLSFWPPTHGLAPERLPPAHFGTKRLTAEALEQAIRAGDPSVFDMDRETYEILKRRRSSESMCADFVQNHQMRAWRVRALAFWETCFANDPDALQPITKPHAFQQMLAYCFEFRLSAGDREELDAYARLLLRVGLPLQTYSYVPSSGWTDLARKPAVTQAVERVTARMKGGALAPRARRQRYPKPAISPGPLGTGGVPDWNAHWWLTPDARLLNVGDRELGELWRSADRFDVLSWLETLQDERVLDLAMRAGAHHKLEYWGIKRSIRRFLGLPIPDRWITAATLPKIVALASIAHFPIDRVRVETERGIIVLSEHPLAPESNERKAREEKLKRMLRPFAPSSDVSVEGRICALQSLIDDKPPTLALEAQEIIAAIATGVARGAVVPLSLSKEDLKRVVRALDEAFDHSLAAVILAGVLLRAEKGADLGSAVAEQLSSSDLGERERWAWGDRAARISQLPPAALPFVLRGVLGDAPEVGSIDDRLRLLGPLTAEAIEAYIDERSSTFAGLAPLLEKAHADEGERRTVWATLEDRIARKLIDPDTVVRPAVERCPEEVRAGLRAIAEEQIRARAVELAGATHAERPQLEQDLVEDIRVRSGLVPASDLARLALDVLYAHDLECVVPLGDADLERGSLAADRVQSLAQGSPQGALTPDKRVEWQWIESDILRAIKEGRPPSLETLLGLSEAFQQKLVAKETLVAARDASSTEMVEQVADRTRSRALRALWLDRPIDRAAGRCTAPADANRLDSVRIKRGPTAPRPKKLRG